MFKGLIHNGTLSIVSNFNLFASTILIKINKITENLMKIIKGVLFMKAVGVIVEYNPFHYGHAYHLEKAKEITGADVVIAAMSGNFLQRGEPALVSKWVRTEMALNRWSRSCF